MKAIFCDNCGGDEFIEKDGFRICCYCKSKFQIPKEEIKKEAATLALNEDVQKLLRRAKLDPDNASRYAGLILEIDPNNEDAKRLL